jgi:hypothetical protein
MHPNKKKLVGKPFIRNTRVNLSIFVGGPLLFCEGQRLFHLWFHILISLVLYLDESSKQKLMRKQFILNKRFNPSIFTGEPMLFCED